VFHVASPCYFPESFSDADAQAILQPAIEGTRRILQYCQDTKSVRKLVMTSCTDTLCGDWDSNKTYNESSWNDKCSARNNVYAFR
jgi:dihydroflavonol-4-reductase